MLSFKYNITIFLTHPKGWGKDSNHFSTILIISALKMMTAEGKPKLS
jgi:hypothetical protein